MRSLPTDTKETRLAVLTPPHSEQWATFNGEIKEGYGKGKQYIIYDDQGYIRKISPNKIILDMFYAGKPRRYAFIKTHQDKYVIKLMKTRPENKVKFSDWSSKDFGKIKDLIHDPNVVVQPKIDGVGVTIEGHPNGLSVVTTKSGLPVMLPEFAKPVNDKLKNSKLHAELFFLDKDGKVLPVNDTVSIVASKKKPKDVKPKLLIFDAEKIQGEDVWNKPYSEKLPLIKNMSNYIDVAMFPETYKDPTSSMNLVNKVFAGEHPLTKEGVVFRKLDEPHHAIKYKKKFEYDVYVCKIFKGKGKYSNAAGGFYYSFDPQCNNIIGKVGTGFSDALRKKLWRQQYRFIGKVAKITGSAGAKDAIRNPKFNGWHHEKNGVVLPE